MNFVISPGIKALTLVTLLSSCASLNQRIHKSPVFSKNHTGFYLFDPETKKVLADYNGHKYFTPASNTKIFTFYTGLRVLGDSVPALRYVAKDDSLIVWGTGDPSFLHPDLPDSRLFDFLRGTEKKVYFSTNNFQDEKFGPGWAWDDYPYYYQAEKSPFPMYGNVVKIINKEDTAGISLSPSYFEKFLYPVHDTMEAGRIRRDGDRNIFNSGPQPDTIDFERWVPFKYSDQLLSDLMEDTLGVQIMKIDRPITPESRVMYSVPADSLYKVMMQVSDNFIAEQIMLLCAGVVSDTLNTRIGIEYSKKNFLADLPDDPVWMDGSGLSRYNLFTPRSIVRLWAKIYEIIPEERLFAILPAGGDSGTIRNWYKAEEPYIYGKTGTLRNNHSLSGFLITHSGKRLIFSFMHNNYTSSSSVVKEEMERTLRLIYEKY